MQSSTVQVPWAAWHGDSPVSLTFPSTWNVASYRMADAPPLSREHLAAAFSEPVESLPLVELLQGKRRVAVAVDDLSRPTPADQVLDVLFDVFIDAGIALADVTVIISLGAHTPLGRAQLERKVGARALAECRVINHDCRANLAPSGAFAGKAEVLLNKDFLDADCRLLIGSVVPHHFAGFSGSAKMVLPGLADLESIARTHKAVLMGLRGKAATLDENRFRTEFERVARHVGVDMAINVVVNGQRKISGLFAGDLVAAHRRAMQFAREVYATPAPAAAVDVAVLNAYPKDTELIQAENAFTLLHTSGVEVVRENGTIVLTDACSEGIGRHGLFEPDGVLYRKPVPKAFLKGRHLIFFSQNIGAADFAKIYHESYQFCSDWSEVIASLKTRHGDPCDVAVFPHASIQIMGDAS